MGKVSLPETEGKNPADGTHQKAVDANFLPRCYEQQVPKTYKQQITKQVMFEASIPLRGRPSRNRTQLREVGRTCSTLMWLTTSTGTVCCSASNRRGQASHLPFSRSTSGGETSPPQRKPCLRLRQTGNFLYKKTKKQKKNNKNI